LVVPITLSYTFPDNGEQVVKLVAVTVDSDHVQLVNADHQSTLLLQVECYTFFIEHMAEIHNFEFITFLVEEPQIDDLVYFEHKNQCQRVHHQLIDGHVLIHEYAQKQHFVGQQGNPHD